MALAPDDALSLLLREALSGVERELALEDAGWINLSSQAGLDVLPANERKVAVAKSRIYATKDPLGRQAIRLWTDYTFGTGMNWNAEDKNASEVLSAFWRARANAPLLSSAGQRKSSDRLLVDGEIFLVLFLGAEGGILRRVDPLEITEFLCDPDDAEDVRYYKREWMTTQAVSRVAYYRTAANADNKPCLDGLGLVHSASTEGVMFHLAVNTIGQRGNPLLLPALDWIRLYRQFLAARAAVMLALARFAWKKKVTGGALAVEAVRAKLQDQLPAAGSVAIENLGSELIPLSPNSQARNAYDDARLLKLQVCAAVGLPEQYFGDISIGNLATAETTELPLMKMFQSYQKIWGDQYDAIDQMVLEQAGVQEDKRYVDRDFPAITPEDASKIAQSLAAILQVLPNLGDSRDVQQAALAALGISDTNEVLNALTQEAKSDPSIALVRALRQVKEAARNGHNRHGD